MTVSLRGGVAASGLVFGLGGLALGVALSHYSATRREARAFVVTADARIASNALEDCVVHHVDGRPQLLTVVDPLRVGVGPEPTGFLVEPHERRVWRGQALTGTKCTADQATFRQDLHVEGWSVWAYIEEANETNIVGRCLSCVDNVPLQPHAHIWEQRDIQAVQFSWSGANWVFTDEAEILGEQVRPLAEVDLVSSRVGASPALIHALTKRAQVENGRHDAAHDSQQRQPFKTQPNPVVAGLSLLLAFVCILYGFDKAASHGIHGWRGWLPLLALGIVAAIIGWYLLFTPLVTRRQYGSSNERIQILYEARGASTSVLSVSELA